MYDILLLQNDRIYALMSCFNDTNSITSLNTPCSVTIGPRMVLESVTATSGSEKRFR